MSDPLLQWMNVSISGQIEGWIFTRQRERNEGCVTATRGVDFFFGGGASEGDTDELLCNPLTCALVLTCTHEHRSAELSVAQKHTALLPTHSPRCFVSAANVPTHTHTVHTLCIAPHTSL